MQPRDCKQQRRVKAVCRFDNFFEETFCLVGEKL